MKTLIGLSLLVVEGALCWHFMPWWAFWIALVCGTASGQLAQDAREEQ